MRSLVVDWTRCDGHGLCAALMPEHIGRDEWGYPLISPTAATDERSARRVAAVCPALAFRVEDVQATPSDTAARTQPVSR